MAPIADGCIWVIAEGDQVGVELGDVRPVADALLQRAIRGERAVHEDDREVVDAKERAAAADGGAHAWQPGERARQPVVDSGRSAVCERAVELGAFDERPALDRRRRVPGWDPGGGRRVAG